MPHDKRLTDPEAVKASAIEQYRDFVKAVREGSRVIVEKPNALPGCMDAKYFPAEALSAALQEAVTDWQPIETAPLLENVLIAQAGNANMVTAYRGDGSPKHPDCWIDLFTRSELNEFEQPTHWMPLLDPPRVRAMLIDRGE